MDLHESISTATPTEEGAVRHFERSGCGLNGAFALRHKRRVTRRRKEQSFDLGQWVHTGRVTPPPNNPLKMPFFLVCAGIGLVVVAVGVGSGTWWIAAIGLATSVGCVACARVIRQGRNPWWIRSPLDGRWPRPKS